MQPSARKRLPRIAMKAYRDRHPANRRNTRNSIRYMQAGKQRDIVYPKLLPILSREEGGIAEVCSCDRKSICRATLNEIPKSAVSLDRD